MVPSKPRHQVSNEFFINCIRRGTYLHVAPINDTIHTTSLSEEEHIEEVNQDDGNEVGEEKEWDDEYEPLMMK